MSENFSLRIIIRAYLQTRAQSNFYAPPELRCHPQTLSKICTSATPFFRTSIILCLEPSRLPAFMHLCLRTLTLSIIGAIEAIHLRTHISVTYILFHIDHFCSNSTASATPHLGAATIFTIYAVELRRLRPLVHPRFCLFALPRIRIFTLLPHLLFAP